MPKTETATAPTRTANANGAAPFDVAALRVALAKAAGVPKASRPALAKLIGAHPNSIALWESGRVVGDRFLQRLRDLAARVARGEKINLGAKAKGGRPKKDAKKTSAAKKTTPRPAANKKGQEPASLDVRALRSQLGGSRAAFAKLLRVSAGSVLNWEAGKPITAKNLTRIRRLAAKTKKGEVTLPEAKKRGRPAKAVAVPSTASTVTRGRAPTVAITGSVPPAYANVIQVVRGEREALVRFGLSIPGEGSAHSVVEVLVSIETLDTLR